MTCSYSLLPYRYYPIRGGSLRVPMTRSSSQEIVFQQITSPEQLILQVDTENADSVRRIPIGQSEALVVVKDSHTQIVWRVDDVFLSVSANHITEAEALAFAYGVEKR